MNSLKINEVQEEYDLPDYIYNQIQVIKFSSDINTMYDIKNSFQNKFDSHCEFKEIFGTMFKYSDSVFYLVYEAITNTVFSQGMIIEPSEKSYGETKYVPRGVEKNDLIRLEEYFKHKNFEAMLQKEKQIKKLNRNVFFAMDQNITFHSGSKSTLTYAKFTGGSIEFSVIGNILQKLYSSSNGLNLNFIKNLNSNDHLTAYLCDDGTLKILSYKKTQILYSVKVFNEEKPSKKPLQIFLTRDSNFLVLDADYKYLGNLRYPKEFENYDFVLPDGHYLVSENGKFSGGITFRNYISIKEKNGEEKEAIDSLLIKGIHGYFVVEKNTGILYHIYYNLRKFNEKLKKNVDYCVCMPFSKDKTGPFSLRISNDGELELVDGQGKYYWRSTSITHYLISGKIIYDGCETKRYPWYPNFPNYWGREKNSIYVK